MEHDWNFADSRRTAFYSSLPSGKYTFKVRSSYHDQTWSEPTEIQIIIKPPFWKTWWAFVFYALIISTVLCRDSESSTLNNCIFLSILLIKPQRVLLGPISIIFSTPSAAIFSTVCRHLTG